MFFWKLDCYWLSRLNTFLVWSSESQWLKPHIDVLFHYQSCGGLNQRHDMMIMMMKLQGQSWYPRPFWLVGLSFCTEFLRTFNTHCSLYIIYVIAIKNNQAVNFKSLGEKSWNQRWQSRNGCNGFYFFSSFYAMVFSPKYFPHYIVPCSKDFSALICFITLIEHSQNILEFHIINILGLIRVATVNNHHFFAPEVAVILE